MPAKLIFESVSNEDNLFVFNFMRWVLPQPKPAATQIDAQG